MPGRSEITLLGQNVNAWTRRRAAISARLIRELDRIPGLARIRYTTSHPNDMTQGLIDAHRDVEKLMPFLHLPVQSGSDRVLKAMNRSHTPRQLPAHRSTASAPRAPTSRCRATSSSASPARPRPSSPTRCSLVDAVGYAQAFSFKYSPRPGTPAADMAGQIAPR